MTSELPADGPERGQVPEEPSDLEPRPDEPSDLSDLDVGLPATDDDSNWDVFIPDDDQRDPLPDPRDFWIDTSPEADGDSRELATGDPRFDGCSPTC